MFYLQQIVLYQIKDFLSTESIFRDFQESIIHGLMRIDRSFLCLLPDEQNKGTKDKGNNEDFIHTKVLSVFGCHEYV